jgi:hypothetical protein
MWKLVNFKHKKLKLKAKLAKLQLSYCCESLARAR